MSECKIILLNYNGCYRPGSQIEGRLECNFTEEITLRSIKIQLKCQEQNKWTNSKKRRPVSFSGENDILFIEQLLCGSDSGSYVLNRGQHVYTFNYVLPDNVPSSFFGPYGSIAYKIQAVVDIPLGYDYEDTVIFNVDAPIDFNKLPKELQNPATYSNDKTVCCCCCHGGEITMTVELPKKAYTPGEVINCKVHISNFSNANMEGISVDLIKKVIYKVTSPKSESKKEKEIITCVKESGVKAHDEHTYDFNLTLPEHFKVPNFSRCQLHSVSYTLKIMGLLSFFHLDMEIEVCDLEMGHIRWMGSQLGFVNLPSAVPYVPASLQYPMASHTGFMGGSGYPAEKFSFPGSKPSAPSNGEMGDGGGPSAPMELPPPSYEESQVGRNYYPKE